MKVKSLTSILVLFAAASLGFGGPPSGEKLLGELQRVMSDHHRKVQAEGGVPTSRMAFQLVRPQAQQALIGLDPRKVPVEDLENWGMIAFYAGNYPLAGQLFLRRVEEAPPGTDLFMSQMFLFGMAVMAEDAEAVKVALELFKPQTLEQVKSASHYLLGEVVDFLNDQREFELARSVIDRWETLLLAAIVVHDQSFVGRMQPADFEADNGRQLVVEAKARVLVAEGKVDQAKALLRSEGEKFANDSRVRERLLQGVRRLDLVGKHVPAVPVVRQSGEFRTLDELKGKVVIVYFHPRLDRFAFGRFAEAKAIEQALYSLDVETVFVSTFFDRSDSSPFPGERQFEEVIGAIERAGTNFPVVFTTDDALAEWGVSQRIVAAVIGSDGRLLGFVNDTPNLEVHIRRLIESSSN